MSGRIGGLEQLADRASRLRAVAGELGEAELKAYEPVLTALRLPAGDSERAAGLAVALSAAAETPLAIAACAAELAELALESARRGKEHLRGDALAGLSLAAGACEAAGRLVVINLAAVPGDQRVIDAARYQERAAQARSVADRGGGEL